MPAPIFHPKTAGDDLVPNCPEKIAGIGHGIRKELVNQAATLTARLKEGAHAPSPMVSEAERHGDHAVAEDFDPKHGGFSGAPKFPPATGLSLLLRCLRAIGDSHTLHMVRKTLDEMAAGGMYDHIGGGFARYSTDDRWLVPHFEKMLYDNALLAHVYVEAYQVTGDSTYHRIATETLDYVLREMTAPDGGFTPPPTPIPKGWRASFSSGHQTASRHRRLDG
ncbi:MAG: hypothetical protein U0231_16295 [Nitrospiraceae bacterium]